MGVFAYPPKRCTRFGGYAKPPSLQGFGSRHFDKLDTTRIERHHVHRLEQLGDTVTLGSRGLNGPGIFEGQASTKKEAGKTNESRKACASLSADHGTCETVSQHTYAYGESKLANH